MRLTTDDIASIVLAELNTALGCETDVLAIKRANALAYYQGALPAPVASIDPVTGEVTYPSNNIVSMDIADAVHSLLSEIQPIVKSTAVEFEPESQEDEPAAQCESDCVRKIIEREGGFTAIFNCIHDSLLTNNGWLKIDMHDSEEMTEAHYPPISDPMQIAILGLSQNPNEKKEVEIEEDGSVTVYTTTNVRKIRFESIAPENILYSSNTNANGLDDLRFVAESKLFTVSQLSKLGVPDEMIENIPDEFPASNTIGSISRAGSSYSDVQSIQEAERLKKVYICYIKLSRNDNNISELHEVWVGGNQVLLIEPTNYIPYITGSAIPMPHRIEGQGIAELLASVQDGKTYILRKYLDNLNVMNSSRLGVVDGQVNMDDLTNGRVNGLVRMRNPNAIMPLPSTDIGAQALQGLNYLDQVRTERIGSSVDFNEAQNQLMKSSAAAANGMLAKVEKMSGWFATNLVETLIKPAFAMVHRILREESDAPISAKLRGKWITTNPSEWKVRKNIVISMGMTTTERAARVNALTTVITQQSALMQAGAVDVLVDFKKVYNSMADWIRSNNLGDPDEYLVDPTSQEALQFGAQKDQKAQQEKQQAQADLIMFEKIKNEFEMQKTMAELQFKYHELAMKTQTEEVKLDTELEIQTAKNATDMIIQANRTEAQRKDATVGASGNE
jgi:hypothetical protein